MKNFNLAIITTIALSLSLTSCGGTTIEAAEGPNINPSETRNPSSTSLSISSSVGEFASVEVESTIELYPSGGVAPYTFDLLSGDGSINNSAQTFTANNSESTVGIRVTDAAGNTAEHYFYVVSYDVDESTDTCVVMGDATQAQGNAQLERAVNLDSHSNTQAAHVMTGIGLRAKNDTLYSIYVKSEKMNADGTVTETPAYATTSYYDDGNGDAVEVFVEAPAGYFIYGVGAAVDASGDDIELIKVYVARANTATDSFDTQECLAFADGSLECDTTVDLPASVNRYAEFAGRSNKALTAFGAAINDGFIDQIGAWSRALSFETCE